MNFFLLLATTVFLAGCAHAQPSAEPISFRVMTYNIRHGVGMDNKLDLPRIAEVIQREKADIVALQEVDKGVARTSRRDLTTELAKLTGMTGVFSNNHKYQGGDYGNAILSRFPVLQQTNFHYQMIRPNEQRGVLQLVLDVHGKKLLFMCTHIDYRQEDEERKMNVVELKGIVAAHAKMPIILCGDFNSTPDSKIHEMAKKFLADSWELIGSGVGSTFPSDKPDRRIDYIWISPESIRPIKIWVPKSDASDHVPVAGEFFLK